MYRLLVTGSRTWPDPTRVWDYLYVVFRDHRNLVVVHGDCPTGADKMAKDWCVANNVPQERHPADWSKGKGAGFARNSEMVKTKPDRTVAFIHKMSNGATHCAIESIKAKIMTDVISA